MALEWRTARINTTVIKIIKERCAQDAICLPGKRFGNISRNSYKELPRIKERKIIELEQLCNMPRGWQKLRKRKHVWINTYTKQWKDHQRILVY